MKFARSHGLLAAPLALVLCADLSAAQHAVATAPKSIGARAVGSIGALDAPTTARTAAMAVDPALDPALSAMPLAPSASAVDAQTALPDQPSNDAPEAAAGVNASARSAAVPSAAADAPVGGEGARLFDGGAPDGKDLTYRTVREAMRPLEGGGYLSPSERDEIASYFSGSGLEREASKKAFARVLALRLEHASPLVRQIVLYSYQRSLRLPRDFGPRKFAGKVEKIDRVIVAVPKKYRGTALEYLIWTHELEHVVHWASIAVAAAKLAKAQNLSPRMKEAALGSAVAAYMSSIRVVRASERGTMMAEWFYLSVLPESLKKTLIERVMSDAALRPKDRKVPLMLLKSAARTPNGHVLDQQKNGRYENLLFEDMAKKKENDRRKRAARRRE